MELTSTVRLHAAPHPDQQVRRAGFPLDHLYVEQCWAAVLGPSSVLLLRRASELWEQELSPTIPVKQLSAMVGLGSSHGRRGVLWRTFDRLDRFGFAKVGESADITIYTHAPPLTPTQLGRVPAWTRDRHYVLLDDHLARLAQVQERSTEHGLARDPAAQDPEPISTSTPTLSR